MSFRPIPFNYDGTIGEYFSKYIEPNLPQKDNVRRIHEMLMSYIVKPDLVVVRAFSPLFEKDTNNAPIRGKIISAGAHKLIGSDNESAVWFFCRCVENNYPYISIQEMVKNQSFPIADRRAPRTVDWQHYGRVDDLSGFTHAHMFAAKEEVSAENYLARMIRLLHPINHCLIPSVKKTNFDVSEIDGFKQHVTNYWQTILPNEWEEFCNIAIPYFPQQDNSGKTFSYSLKSELLDPSNEFTVDNLNSPDVKKIENQGSFNIVITGNDESNRENSLKLNENYLNSLLRIQLHWRVSGSSSPYLVGSYQLNIKKLLEKGIIYRDKGVGALRLKIQHDGDGNFYLRRTQSGPSVKL